MCVRVRVRVCSVHACVVGKGVPFLSPAAPIPATPATPATGFLIRYSSSATIYWTKDSSFVTISQADATRRGCCFDAPASEGLQFRSPDAPKETKFPSQLGPLRLETKLGASTGFTCFDKVNGTSSLVGPDGCRSDVKMAGGYAGRAHRQVLGNAPSESPSRLRLTPCKPST